MSISASLFVLLALELIYMVSSLQMSEEVREKKRSFVSLVSLPDLALNSDSHALRHRSLSSVGSLYEYDGTLVEYSNASFVFAHGVTR